MFPLLSIQVVNGQDRANVSSAEKKSRGFSCSRLCNGDVSAWHGKCHHVAAGNDERKEVPTKWIHDIVWWLVFGRHHRRRRSIPHAGSRPDGRLGTIIIGIIGSSSVVPVSARSPACRASARPRGIGSIIGALVALAIFATATADRYRLTWNSAGADVPRRDLLLKTTSECLTALRTFHRRCVGRVRRHGEVLTSYRARPDVALQNGHVVGIVEEPAAFCFHTQAASVAATARVLGRRLFEELKRLTGAVPPPGRSRAPRALGSVYAKRLTDAPRYQCRKACR